MSADVLDEPIGPTPAPPIPAVDTARYSKLLLKIEQHAHRHGWDGPVHMRLSIDEALTDPAAVVGFRNLTPPDPRYTPIRHDGYTAISFFGHRVLYQRWETWPPEVREYLRSQCSSHDLGMSGPPPWVVLRHMVMNTAYGDADSPLVQRMRAIIREPGVIGFVVVSEAHKIEGREKLLDAATGEQRIEDMPGSVEVRRVLSLDLPGRFEMVERVRRHKPVAFGVDMADVLRQWYRLEVERGASPREIRRAMRRHGLPDPGPHLVEAIEQGVDLNEFDWSPTTVSNVLMRGDLSTSMRIFRDTVLDRLPRLEEFDVRYPTLHALMTAECSDPREPDGCPTEDHDHHNPFEFRVVDGKWYRGGDW